MCHRMITVAHINEPSATLDSGHQDSAMRGPLIWFHGQGIIVFYQFWKLGFCSISECEIFAHGGQLHILLDREHVASVPTWRLPKNACMTH